MIYTYCVARKVVLKLRNFLRLSAATIALTVDRDQTEQICESLIFIM